AARAAQSPALFAIDVGSGPDPAARPECPAAERRFRDWLKLRYPSQEPTDHADVIDRETFVAFKLREDLKLEADAASPRGLRPVASHAGALAILLDPRAILDPRALSGAADDWWMSTAVDAYGMSLAPKSAASGGPWAPARLGAMLDAMRSIAR